jgi:uncharacterized membrane protein YuzA (DUF378 family)
MNTFDKLALLLVIIGAVNWGCIGLFSLDLVALLFGEMSLLSRIVYSLVGVSGLWCLTLLFRDTEEVHHAVHA